MSANGRVNACVCVCVCVCVRARARERACVHNGTTPRKFILPLQTAVKVLHSDAMYPVFHNAPID